MPFNFDIDRYLNPFIPRPRLYALPTPISRFLGYRAPGSALHTKDATVWFWGFIGAFVGIAAIEGIFLNIGGRLEELGVPMVIGSFGATAILLFHSLDSPLSQPRNVLMGQLISAITGISLTKLFLLSSRFDDLIWLAGAISCAIALVLMAITKTTHPPAGATALIAAVDKSCRGLGWWYVPCVLLSACVMVVVACIVDNVSRRYPTYWWTPVPLGELKKKDVEAAVPVPNAAAGGAPRSSGQESEKASTNSRSSQSATEVDEEEDLAAVENTVVVTAEDLRIPRWLKEELGDESLGILREIQSRLAEVERGEGTDELKRIRTKRTASNE